MTIAMILFGIWLIYIATNKNKGTPAREVKRNKQTRKANSKIETELVPMAMHGLNVRSRVDYKTWMKIAHASHKANRTFFKTREGECEVCLDNGHRQGFNHPLEAHEEWSFNHDTRTQKLTRIRSLCPLCHKAVHMGLSDKLGFGQRARQHMMEVNNWNALQTEEHIAEAKRTVRGMNNNGQYKLDLRILNSPIYANAHNFRFTENETNNCRPGIFE